VFVLLSFVNLKVQMALKDSHNLEFHGLCQLEILVSCYYGYNNMLLFLLTSFYMYFVKLTSFTCL